jgi:hypothetical protein
MSTLFFNAYDIQAKFPRLLSLNIVGKLSFRHHSLTILRKVLAAFRIMPSLP